MAFSLSLTAAPRGKRIKLSLSRLFISQWKSRALWRQSLFSPRKGKIETSFSLYMRQPFLILCRVHARTRIRTLRRSAFQSVGPSVGSALPFSTFSGWNLHHCRFPITRGWFSCAPRLNSLRGSETSLPLFVLVLPFFSKYSTVLEKILWRGGANSKAAFF